MTVSSTFGVSAVSFDGLTFLTFFGKSEGTKNGLPLRVVDNFVLLSSLNFGMQNQNYLLGNNGNNSVQPSQHIIITSPNNTTSSPGGRPHENNNQPRVLSLSPSVLVSAPISPQQQLTKIIIPNGPNSPLQPVQQNAFQQYMSMDNQQPQTYLSANAFNSNPRLSPSYQQLSPNQNSWSGYNESTSPTPSNQSSSQKKRKRNGSNAGSNQSNNATASESDYVEIRDDLLKKINDSDDENVYSLRLYNESTKQYTVLMSTVHKPVKQLCSSKKRKKLNQILAPVLAKFGVDADTLIQIKEVRSLIKNTKKGSSPYPPNDNDSGEEEEEESQPQQTRLAPPQQQQQSMMGILQDLGNLPNDLQNDKDLIYYPNEADFVLPGNFLTPNISLDPNIKYENNNDLQ